MSFCDGNWYTSYYPNIDADDSHRFEILVSKGAFSDLAAQIQCECSNTTSVDASDSQLVLTEIAFMNSLTMILGLLFLAFIMMRSCSLVQVDWYRLIFIYILGTLAVPLTLALGPTCAGFNRVIGFGILFHNMSEWFLLGRIWIGNQGFHHNSKGTLFIVFYFWVILGLNSLLPLAPLFFILMVQGAFLDWSLVFTFLFAGQKMQNKKNGGNYFWYGFAAALTHILSIQSLFFEFSLSKPVLAIPTVILLVPTFILYIWWSSADSDYPISLISPPKTGASRQMFENNLALNNIQKELNVIISHESNSESLNNNVPVAVDSKDKPISPIIEVLERGLKNLPGGAKTFWYILGVASFICIGNSLLVFFAPCYVDVHAFVCG